jgi:hypothetical protein
VKHCNKCNRDLPEDREHFYFAKTRGVYNSPCIECIKAASLILYQKQRRKSICVSCSAPVLTGNSPLCPVCRKKQNAHARVLRSTSKFVVFNHYGGFVCSCCGTTEPEFLTLEHLNGGGTKHRREVGYGSDFYRWIIKNNFPPGYAILCMNCNFAKGKYGYCPHQKTKAAVA